MAGGDGAQKEGNSLIKHHLLEVTCGVASQFPQVSDLTVF